MQLFVAGVLILSLFATIIAILWSRRRRKPPIPEPDASLKHDHQDRERFDRDKYWADIAALTKPLSATAVAVSATADNIYPINPITRPRRPSGSAATSRNEKGEEKHKQRREARSAPWYGAVAAEDSDDQGDDGYAEFVRSMWVLRGIPLGDRTFTRLTFHGERREVVLASLVTSAHGTGYINGLEAGVRKTFRADGHHHWSYDGHPVDEAAFAAIGAGVESEVAFAIDDPPKSAAEALDPKYNRFQTNGHQYVIGYVNAEGIASFRVISRVLRGDGKLSARCHYRWGARREFRFDRIQYAANALTGEVIPLPEFLSNRKP